ncbi:hypothetical protein DRN67_00020 [Candidatus Micrarchaeota archaeon]|nr:MAG: hypothetical protein DRN67_00020 [Candidatus Micrarchaeota archaeon]
MRAMAGMFIIIVVLLGMIAWVFQNDMRESHLVIKESQINEVRSNRLAILRNVIERTYEDVEPKHRAAWENSIEDKLGPLYGVEVVVDQNSIPPTAVLEDRTYGLVSEFYLPTGQS